MNSNKNNREEILIVEDSPTQAQMLKFLLEKHDYHVTVANNGKEALEKINVRKPTIIISDIIMPEMNGFELCRHIKETENLKDIPVILLTALCDPKDVLKGLECGANNFITKPYEEKYLISRVQSILADRLSPESEKIQFGVKVFFGGQEYYITAQHQQILNLLLSTYETAVQKNLELQKVQDELRTLTLDLERKVEERTIELKSVNEQLSKDIIERKQAEEQMRYQSTLLANVNDAIVASDENYKITAWNAAAESLYGWKSEEVLGRSALEIVQTDYGSKDKGEMLREIEAAGRWRGEVTQVRKDGTRIPVEVSSIVLHDKNDRITGFVSANRDITERKIAQEAKRESEAKFQSIFEQSPIAIEIYDAQGKLVDTNRSCLDMFGLSEREHVLGFELFSDPNISDDAKQRLAQGETVSFESVFDFDLVLEKKFYPTTRSGICYIDCVIHPLLDINSKFTGYIVHVRDITERKRVEEELKRHRDHLEQLVKERTMELEKKNSELEHFNRVFVGRELRMIELKKIIAEYEKKIAQLEKEKID